jgi:hypothetical protein
LISRFDRESLSGFVSPQSYLGPTGLEMLDVAGNLLIVPYEEIKVVCFVRDFGAEEIWRAKSSFASRPKIAGLWVRMRFRDGETLEGLLPNNLLLQEPQGFHFIPPDPAFQNQKLFVPRLALTDVQVLGVIGSPLRRPRTAKPAKRTQDERQLDIFNRND